jgi:hypothetical protein
MPSVSHSLTIGSTTLTDADIISISGPRAAYQEFSPRPGTSEVTIDVRNWNGASYLSSSLNQSAIGSAATLVETISGVGNVTLYDGYLIRIELITRDKMRLVLGGVLSVLGNPKFPAVETSTFPQADPDDIGKSRNIIYGAVKRVPARAVVAGAVDTLVADITAGATSITVSQLTKVSFSSSGTIQIDEEKINYTSYSGGVFSGLTRGAGGTTAVAHSKGAKVFQVLSSYKYEVACHPMTSIDAVYVDGVKQTSGYSVNLNDSGAATVTFTVKPIIKKQVNIEVLSEHGHTTNTGSHSHSVSSPGTLKKYGASVSQSGTVYNRDRIIDGSEIDPAQIGASNGSAGGTATVTMTSGGSGTLSAIYVWAKLQVGGTPGPLAAANVGCGGTWASAGSCTSAGWYKFTFTSGLSWSSTISFTATQYGSSDFYIMWVWEMYVEYVFTPSTNSGPASGVSTSVSGSTVLGGNSSAEVVVGSRVTVDGTGYNLTAAAGVISHLVQNYYGITPTVPSLSGYSFAGVIGDMGQDGLAVIGSLALQCGCVAFERAGQLYFASAAGGSSSYTLTDADLLDEPSFGYIGLDGELKHLRLFYSRDRDGLAKEGRLLVRDVDAVAAGYLASTETGTSPNNPSRTLLAPLVDDSTTASNLLSAWWGRLGSHKRTLECTVRWLPQSIRVGDIITYAGLFPSTNYRVFDLTLAPASGSMRLRAIQT